MNKKPLLLLISFLVFSVSYSQVKYFKMPAHVADSDYISRTVIFKIKPAYRSECNENNISIPKLNNAFNALGSSQLVKKFPGKKPPATALNRYGEKMVDLSLIYELKYSASFPIEKAINILLKTGTLEYAEPHYLPHSLNYYIPNDPYSDTLVGGPKQWHLKTIKAYQAWDIQKGDTNVVIGITDTGTDSIHPDLSPNVKLNYADPVNGIDDDGDGFLDNYYGWDMGNNDNNPEWDNLGHGVFVSGLPSSVVDNSIGCAGVGFKCKFLPIKIVDDLGVFTMAYEGIVYAVDHGCNIVNCSWGGFGGEGQFGQDIIDYATNNLNALVVAASGNFHNNFPVYPAAYDNVLSVTATDIHDQLWDNSTWGTTVDISAPGDSVLSTWINQNYLFSSGTSFSSPVVAGAAGIIKAQYPNYSAIQIGARLQATADNIDAIPFNAPYAGLMGSGRLNMYKALTDSTPWIKMIYDSITDHNDMTFVGGDTLFIYGLYKNYLSPSSSVLKAVISSQSPYVNILDSSYVLGQINTFGTKNNFSNPFRVKILANVPLSTQLDFKITFKDPNMNYSSFQYFSVIANKDYLNIDTNLVATTMTSKGIIGYNEQNSLTQGIGFTYNGSASHLKCGGFVVGNSTSKVSDDIYGQVAGTFDNDFKTIYVVHKINPPVLSDFDAECVFNDDNVGTNKLNISINNKAFAWDTITKEKFIIMEYTIKNNGTSTLNTLFAGLFMDFDLSSDGTQDRINFDPVNKMSYTYASQGGAYIGIKLLSNSTLHHYAFDKDGGSNSLTTSINLLNGFSSYYKYSALKIFPNRDMAGVPSQYANGNDVADMLSTGPFILSVGDSVKVSFALIAGDHLADLQASAYEADQAYNHVGIEENTMENRILLSDVFPNPSNDAFSFNIQLPTSADVLISLVNAVGKEVQLINSGKMTPGNHSFTLQTKEFAAGIYYLRLFSGSTIITRDVTIVR